MILWAAIGAIGIAFWISAFSTFLARRVAFHFNMLDVPAGHKAHAAPVPLLGGSAILAGVLGPTLLALALARIWAAEGVPPWLQAHFPDLAIYLPGVVAKTPMAMGVLAGAVALHIVGLIDDRRTLGAWTKMAAQVVVSVCVVLFCDVRVLTAWGKPVSILVSILWLVVITNAFNFLDNMDGLAAGVAAICAVALLGAAASLGQVFVSSILCLILGAVGGFLLFNFPPAHIFMGDAGSLVIGYLLAVASCLTTYVPATGVHHLYSVLVPVVLMAVPLYDTMSVIVLRLRARRNPMIGDQRHFSHRLVRRGMSPRAAVLTIYLCAGTTAASASLLPHVDKVGAVMVFFQTVAILGIIALLESNERKP